MKRKKFLAVLLSASMCMGVFAPIHVLADSRKVVTLGVDLSDDQKNKILKYFGVTLDSVDVIYINNQQEREALGSYIPLEQIGTHTYSCAMVSPTTSGGIQVKTANLNYVTCNMIATTLSTSGVNNCQVLAAAPFEVSGTGALTGVIHAYEQAANVTLDPVKKDLANQEMVITSEMSLGMGASEATAVVNGTKEQVIENNVTDIGEINNIVNNIVNEYQVEMSDEEKAKLAELMQKIAEQDYDIAQMKANLAKVQENVISDTKASDEQKAEAAKKAEESAAEALKVAQEALELAKQNQQTEAPTTPQTEAAIEGSVEVQDETQAPETTAPEVASTEAPAQSGDNILNNTDISALEDGSTTVNEGTTTQTVEEQKATDATTQSEDLGIPEATGETFTESGEIVEESTESAEVVETEAPAEEVTEAVVETEMQTEAMTEAVTEAVTEAQTEVQQETQDLGTMSEEDYNIFSDIKSTLDNEFSDTVIPSADGATLVYLSVDSCQLALKDIETYVAMLFGKGVDTISSQEEADETIPKDAFEKTEELVPVKSYVDSRMVQLDKFARRYILMDTNGVFNDSDLADSDKVAVYDYVMSVFEDKISSDVEDTGEVVTEVEDESLATSETSVQE